jgi:hypothetical protein
MLVLLEMTTDGLATPVEAREAEQMTVRAEKGVAAKALIYTCRWRSRCR